MNFSDTIFSLLPKFIQNKIVSLKKKYEITKWNKQGKSIPVPHIIKQELIVKYKDKYEIRTLVESGTYKGGMVWAQRKNFEEIYSIELSKDLTQEARKRFKKNQHIKIIQGDSGKIMPILIKELPQKTLFWLDGHFTGEDAVRGDKDCPVAEEVKAIMSSSIEHIILISNAHNYTGQRDYPTLEGLSKFIKRTHPSSNIYVENDCIVIELCKANIEYKETVNSDQLDV